jgi:putative transposase
MPRRETPFLPAQYYHFYNRGNNRQAVFMERANYLYFLKGIKKYLCAYVDVLAYSRMPTHYHLLGRVKENSEFLGAAVSKASQTSEVLKTSEVSSRQVSVAMQKLGISYTKAINKRFARVGALFQGQFQGKPVKDYEHLLTLCVYIHANPVKDGLVALPEDWEYSNYIEWMDCLAPPATPSRCPSGRAGARSGTLVNRQFVQEHFGTSVEYQTLVLDYLTTRNLPDDLRRQLQALED